MITWTSVVWAPDATSQPVPELYDECSFDSIQDLMGSFITDQKEVVGSCSEVYAVPGGVRVTDSQGLPPEVVAKLDSHGGFGWGIFNATVLNRNRSYTVTKVTITFTPSGKGVTPQMALKTIDHHVDITIRPFAKGTVSIPVETNTEQEYLWKITGAQGYTNLPVKPKAATK